MPHIFRISYLFSPDSNEQNMFKVIIGVILLQGKFDIFIP
jgi:hypothetical protein